MPSSPPSLLPFGNTLLQNGRYLFAVLANMLSSPASSSAYATTTVSTDIPTGALPFFSRPSVSERRGPVHSAIPVDIGLSAIDEESASPLVKSRKVSTADQGEQDPAAVLAMAASLAMVSAQAQQVTGHPGALTLPLQSLLEARSLQTLAAAVSKTVKEGETDEGEREGEAETGADEGEGEAETSDEGVEPALDSTAQELEEALQRTTDLVAQSVHGILKARQAAGGARVLVFGKDSFFRAKYLSQTKSYFAEPVHVLRDAHATEQDGLFWCDDAESLAVVRPACFDVVLCFNLTGTSRSDVVTVVRDLERTLRPGGCFVGTGVFKGAAEESIGETGPRVTLRQFRQYVEEHGFYMHTAIDMSLEGNIILKVASDLDNSLASSLDAQAQQQHPLEMVRNGELVCARFLATKDAQPGAVSTPPKQVVSVATTTEGSRIVGRKISDADLVRPSSITSPSPSTNNMLKEKELETGSLLSLRQARQDNSSVSVTTTLSSPAVALQTPPVVPTQRRTSPLARTLSLPSVQPQLKDSLVVTGISLGLPNALYPDRPVFDPRNFDYLFRGDNCISYLTQEEKNNILGQNIVQVSKKEGKRVEHVIRNDKDCIQVASKIGKFDLAREYGVPQVIVETLDTTYQLAIAAGLEAMRDAGIPLDLSKRGPSGKPMGLPEDMQEDTGVIFASSFPGLDSCVEEVTKCVAAKAKRELIEDLKLSLSAYLPFQFAPQTEGVAADASNNKNASPSRHAASYQYNRKLLFRLLVMANAQLAELINARGPNTQCNSACSGTTQAIAIAEDWIRTGRCKRVIVIAADNATSELLLPYLGTGFLALGAASTAGSVEDAAVPFDKRRKGMILGAGACGLVLEAGSRAVARQAPVKSELLASWVKNSAFHACLMDKEHIAAEMKKFVDKLEADTGLDRHEIARDCIYFAHETGTSANGGCAQVEMDALLRAFGEKSKNEIMIANTKGFTGHPMGVGMEDVVAVASLAQGFVPPIANHKITDPALGTINLSRGGVHTRNYVLRLAAGFGSQFTILLFRKWDPNSPQARQAHQLAAQEKAGLEHKSRTAALPPAALTPVACNVPSPVAPVHSPFVLPAAPVSLSSRAMHAASACVASSSNSSDTVSVSVPVPVALPLSLPMAPTATPGPAAVPGAFSPLASLSQAFAFRSGTAVTVQTPQHRVRQRAFMTID